MIWWCELGSVRIKMKFMSKNGDGTCTSNPLNWMAGPFKNRRQTHYHHRLINGRCNVNKTFEFISILFIALNLHVILYAPWYVCHVPIHWKFMGIPFRGKMWKVFKQNLNDDERVLYFIKSNRNAIEYMQRELRA